MKRLPVTLTLLSIVMSAHLTAGPSYGEDAVLDKVIVTADRVSDFWQTTSASSVLLQDDIERLKPLHVHEAMRQIPGVWVSRGSGQEHLTAIRSPVLTGAGACGGFLYMVDGVPIRPTGFCNINNLFETHYERASAIEVLRGPASSVYGGNALHGAVNIVSRGVTLREDGTAFDLSLDLGSRKVMTTNLGAEMVSGQHGVRLDASSTLDDGYRASSGLSQEKLTLRHEFAADRWTNDVSLAFTNLNQETAGFIQGFKSYKDDSIRFDNPDEEAFRDAWSFRLSNRFTLDLNDGAMLTFTPFFRKSEMEFLQHFLPGDPLEENDQTSGGFTSSYDILIEGGHRLTAGTTIELAQGSLYEFQAAPDTFGSRNTGLHYDYTVNSTSLAAFANGDFALTRDLSLLASLRGEWLEYDYDNKASDGNLKDDGTACASASGCLYFRPADRKDSFADVGGRLGLRYDVAEDLTLTAMGAMGFRPPQATELYRLQSGQRVGDLDSEKITSIEVGAQGFFGDGIEYSVTAYGHKKRNEIFRNADGINVSAAKTRAIGLEAQVSAEVADHHRLTLTATAQRHEYDSDIPSKNIAKGNEVDTAPSYIGSAKWLWTPTAFLSAELEADYMSSYYLDTTEGPEYDGHLVLHVRGDWRVTEAVTLGARVNNLLDRKYADRADFAFGNYRYFPAPPREAFVTMTARF